MASPPSDFKVSVAEIMSSSWLLRLVDRNARRWPGGLRFPRRKLAPDVNLEFLDWVDGLEGRPFFGFLNYIDAHGPYERMEPYFTALASAPSQPTRDPDGQVRERRPQDRDRVDRYDSAIASMDAAITDLTGALAQRGILDRTLIIVTADHGEFLGERGLNGHEGSLYCPLVCVPLLLSYPGRLPEGVRIDAPVSLQGLASTVVDLLDLKSGAPFPSGSLAPRSIGEDRSMQRPPPGVWSQLNPSPYREREGPVEKGPMQSLMAGALHYIRNGDGSEELYDLAVDPWEDRNVVADSAAQAALPGLRAEWRRVQGGS